MANEDRVARRHLQTGEDIVFIQRGGVMTAAIDPRTQQPIPIDEFGTGRGWLAATTTNRVIYGYFGAFGGAKLGGVFPFTRWEDDPRGIAFINEGFGPEDLCVFTPKTIAPEALHAHMNLAIDTPNHEPLDQTSTASEPASTRLNPPVQDGHGTDGPKNAEVPLTGMHDNLSEMTFRVDLENSEYARVGDLDYGFGAAVAHHFFWEPISAALPGWVAVSDGAIYIASGDDVFRIPTNRVRRVGDLVGGEFAFSTADREISLHLEEPVDHMSRFHEELLTSVSAAGNQSDTRFDPSTSVRIAARKAEDDPWRDADEGFIVNAALTAGMADYDLNSLWGLRRTLDDQVVGLEDLAQLGEGYGSGITETASLEGTAKRRMAMYMVGSYLMSYRQDLMSKAGYSYVQEPVKAATMGLIADGSIPFSGIGHIDATERQHKHDMCVELGIEPPPR